MDRQITTYCNCEGKLDHQHGCVYFSRKGPAQDSITDQMHRVMKLATQAGEYDAADWIKRTFFAEGSNK